MPKTRLHLGEPVHLFCFSLVLVGVAIGGGWLFGPANIHFQSKAFPEERVLIEKTLLDISGNLRLYAEANQGTLPESIEPFLRSSEGNPVDWLLDSPAALRYHRSSPSYEEAPPSALFISIAHRSGLLSVTYGGDLVHQPIDQRGRILIRPR